MDKLHETLALFSEFAGNEKIVAKLLPERMNNKADQNSKTSQWIGNYQLDLPIEEL